MSVVLNKLASKMNKQAGIPDAIKAWLSDPENQKLLATYAVPTAAGAGIGALVDKNHWRGAGIGAGAGALLGGAAHAYGKYDKAKKEEAAKKSLKALGLSANPAVENAVANAQGKVMPNLMLPLMNDIAEGANKQSEKDLAELQRLQAARLKLRDKLTPVPSIPQPDPIGINPFIYKLVGKLLGASEDYNPKSDFINADNALIAAQDAIRKRNPLVDYRTERTSPNTFSELSKIRKINYK